MGQVIALADFRTEKLRAQLRDFADGKKAAVVATRTATVCTNRIFCHDTFAVLIDKFGRRTTIEYAHITGVSPMLPAADIVHPLAWQTMTEPRAVLHFRRPSVRS